jgi:hypothetical protein
VNVPIFLHLSSSVFSSLLLVQHSVPLRSSSLPSEPHVFWIFDSCLTSVLPGWVPGRYPVGVSNGLVLTQGQLEPGLALFRFIQAVLYNGTTLFTQQWRGNRPVSLFANNWCVYTLSSGKSSGFADDSPHVSSYLLVCLLCLFVPPCCSQNRGRFPKVRRHVVTLMFQLSFLLLGVAQWKSNPAQLWPYSCVPFHKHGWLPGAVYRSVVMIYCGHTSDDSSVVSE